MIEAGIIYYMYIDWKQLRTVAKLVKVRHVTE